MDYFFATTREQRLKTACQYFLDNKIRISVDYTQSGNKVTLRGFVLVVNEDSFTLDTKPDLGLSYKFVKQITPILQNFNKSLFDSIKLNEGINIATKNDNAVHTDCKIKSIADTQLSFTSKEKGDILSYTYENIRGVSIENIYNVTGGKNKKSRKNKKSLKSKKQNNNKKSRKQRK